MKLLYMLLQALKETFSTDHVHSATAGVLHKRKSSPCP